MPMGAASVVPFHVLCLAGLAAWMGDPVSRWSRVPGLLTEAESRDPLYSLFQQQNNVQTDT